MPGQHGRKHGRNYRRGGVRQSLTSYRQRRALNVPKGGDGGRWRAKLGGSEPGQHVA